MTGDAISTSRYRFAAGAAAVGLWAVLLRLLVVWLNRPSYLDDPFITLRVARNAAEGAGLVFNPGEAVQVVSSPLYGLISAAAWIALGESAGSFTRLLGTLADGVAAVLLYATVAGPRPQGRDLPAGLGAGLIYGALPTAALMTTAGLETGLFVCGTMAVFLALRADRPLAGALAAACAALLRPEGFLVCLVFLGTRWLEQRKPPWREMLLLAAVGATWGTFAHSYYGDVLPQTIHAKDLLERTTLEQWHVLGAKFLYGSPPALVLGTLALVGAVAIVRGRRQLLPLLVWAAAYVTLFSTRGAWWPWYLVPVCLPYAACLGAGLVAASGAVSSIPGFAGRRRQLAVAGALLLALAMTGLTVLKARGTSDYGPAVHEQRRELAAWVEANTPEGTVVMLEPMGIFAYYCRRPIADYPGLASPEVSEALATLGRPIGGSLRDHEALVRAVEAVRPGVLVLRQGEYDVAVEHGAVAGYTVAFVSEVPGEVTARFPGFETMLVLVRDGSRSWRRPPSASP